MGTNSQETDNKEPYSGNDDQEGDTNRRLIMLEKAVRLAEAEARGTVGKWPPFPTPHAGYGVLAEALDELWDAVKGDDVEQARAEAVHVAAMALRFWAEAATCPAMISVSRHRSCTPSKRDVYRLMETTNEQNLYR